MGNSRKVFHWRLPVGSRRLAGMGKRNRTRANGEGWKRRRKDGRWNVGLHVWTSEGLKRRETTKRTSADADRWLTRQKYERDGGMILSGENPYLKDYLERWLEESVRGSVSVKTWKHYRSITENHIIPKLGGVRLKALSSEQVQHLYASKRDYAVATRRHIHVTLNKALNQAASWGHIASNPAARVKPPKSSYQGGKIRPYTTDELARIRGAVRDNRLAALYTFAPATGLREQELCALSWRHLDLPERGKGSVRVEDAVVEVEHGFEIGPVKTKKSRRAVEFSPAVVCEMRRHRQKLLEERLRSGKWEDAELVFPTAHGTLLTRYRLQRYFAKVREKAGVQDHQFRDFRHTFATLLFARGVHPGVVQALMGHESIKITMDTYSAYIPAMGSSAIEVLDDVF